VVQYVQIVNNNSVSKTAKNQEPGPSKTEPILLLYGAEVFLKETKSMLGLKVLEEIEKDLRIRGTNNRSLMYHLTYADVLTEKSPYCEMDVEYKLSFIPRVDARLEEVYNYVIPAVRVYRLI